MEPEDEAGDQLEWRDTYFILFQHSTRPTLTQVEAALSGAGRNLTLENLEADEDGMFESVLVQAVERTETRLLAAWPLPRKAGWTAYVNTPQTAAELRALRRSVNRGSPFGDDQWCERTIRQLHLESTIRPMGRPKKSINGS